MNKRQILHDLVVLLGSGSVLHRPEDLMMYEYDGALRRGKPDFVVFPETTEQVAGVVKLADRENIPFLPRGAGSGLSSGAIAEQGGIVICTSRMKRILSIDLANRLAVVQPGVVTAAISQAVADASLYYVPDPSSAVACTIGGNVAENSGGPHCLAYGVTTNHVLAMEVVWPDGEVAWLGGQTPDLPGYDLTGAMVGSEGTLGIVTQIVVRLTRLPETVRTLLAVFDGLEDASKAVSTIIEGGTIPAAMEMMDNVAIQAIEATKSSGYPTDAGAVLLIDLEGFEEGLDDLLEHIRGVLLEEGASEVRLARDEEKRKQLWSGRKGAFGAMGRISPSYYVQDGVVPRSKLPYVLNRVSEIGDKYGFRIANVFHAGDGNLHPLILFDERDPEQVKGVHAASSEILDVCIEMGGSVTGEHGVGSEKREELIKMFLAEDLSAMKRLHDALNPRGLCNPEKIFPASMAFYEVGPRTRQLPRLEDMS